MSGGFRGGTVSPGGYRGGAHYSAPGRSYSRPGYSWGGFGRPYYGSRFFYGGYPWYGYGFGWPFYGGFYSPYYYGYDPFYYGYGYTGYGYGGYGYGGYPDYGYSGYDYQSQPTVIVNQGYVQTAPPDYGPPQERPSARPQRPLATRSSLYLIAFRDGVIRAVVSYRVDGDNLLYTTRDQMEHSAPLRSIDRDFSIELNRDRGVALSLP